MKLGFKPTHYLSKKIERYDKAPNDFTVMIVLMLIFTRKYIYEHIDGITNRINKSLLTD